MLTQPHVDDDHTTMNSKLVAASMTALCLFTINMTQASTKPVTLKIVETSDVHGAFFPYDFIRRQPKAGSLARVSSYVKGLRAQYGPNAVSYTHLGKDYISRGLLVLEDNSLHLSMAGINISNTIMSDLMWV